MAVAHPDLLLQIGNVTQRPSLMEIVYVRLLALDFLDSKIDKCNNSVASAATAFRVAHPLFPDFTKPKSKDCGQRSA